MLFKVRNLGLIDEAEVKLDGITVLIGKNNVGKSTIGKMLYCVNNVFLQSNVEKMKKSLIMREMYLELNLLFYLTPWEGDNKSSRWERELDSSIRNFNYIEEIVDNKELYLNETADLKKYLNPIFTKSFSQFEDFDAGFIYVVEDIILEALEGYFLNGSSPLYELWERITNVNFPKGICNVYSDNHLTEIELTMGNSGSVFKIDIDEDGYLQTIDAFSEGKFSEELIYEEAIYIENPHIMKEWMKLPNFDGRKRLMQLLTDDLVDDSDPETKKKVDIISSLKDVLDKVSSLIPEKLVKDDSFSNKLEYEELGHKFDLINVSSEIKSFAIIKKLLIEAKLNRNGMLILDDPEIHLHSKWQLVFAEILVLLQKQFNLRILINTHSFDFLVAVEKYSKIHKIDQNCNYYSVERKGNHSIVSDHTDIIDELYLDFSEPMDELE